MRIVIKPINNPNELMNPPIARFIIPAPVVIVTISVNFIPVYYTN